MAFNATGNLILKTPNLPNVIKNIRNGLNSISGNINVTISPKVASQITQLNTKFTTFNATLGQTSIQANQVATALNNLAAAAGSMKNVKAAVIKQNTVLNRGLTTTAAQAKHAGNMMEELGKAGLIALKRFAGFTIATSAVFGFIYAIGNAIREAVAFETQMVKLGQVLPRMEGSVKRISDSIGELSIKFGIASSELADVARTFAQAGFRGIDLERALTAIAKSDLSPTFTDMKNTGEGLIAIFNQFGIKSSQFEDALSSINSVSAAFAIESDDLINAVRKTGGVFAYASKGVSEGVDALNEFIAVMTSVRATTRESADSIATGLRTILTRIQRPRTIEFLRDYNIELTDAQGNFVGAYQALERLGRGLDSLDTKSIRFTRVAEELGGFRQIGKTLPLLKEFEKRAAALDVAKKSKGSIDRDATTGMAALSRQIASVQEQFRKLMRDVFETATFKAFAATILQLAESFISLADALKPIIPLMGAVLAMKAVTGMYHFGKGAYIEAQKLMVAGGARPSSGSFGHTTVNTSLPFSSQIAPIRNQISAMLFGSGGFRGTRQELMPGGIGKKPPQQFNYPAVTSSIDARNKVMSSFVGGTSGFSTSDKIALSDAMKPMLKDIGNTFKVGSNEYNAAANKLIRVFTSYIHSLPQNMRRNFANTGVLGGINQRQAVLSAISTGWQVNRASSIPYSARELRSEVLQRVDSSKLSQPLTTSQKVMLSDVMKESVHKIGTVFKVGTDQYNHALQTMFSSMARRVESGILPTTSGQKYNLANNLYKEGADAGYKYASLGSSLGRFGTRIGNLVFARGLDEQQMADRQRAGMGLSIGAMLAGGYLGSRSESRVGSTIGSVISGAGLGGMVMGPYGAALGGILASFEGYHKGVLKEASNKLKEFSNAIEKSNDSLNEFVRGNEVNQAEAQSILFGSIDTGLRASLERREILQGYSTESLNREGTTTNWLNLGRKAILGSMTIAMDWALDNQPFYEDRESRQRSSIGSEVRAMDGFLGGYWRLFKTNMYVGIAQQKEITKMGKDLHNFRMDAAVEEQKLSMDQMNAIRERAANFIMGGKRLVDEEGRLTDFGRDNIGLIQRMAFAGTNEDTNIRNRARFNELGDVEREAFQLQAGITAASTIQRSIDEQIAREKALAEMMARTTKVMEDFSLAISNLSAALDRASVKNKQLSDVANQMFDRALSGSNRMIAFPQDNVFANARDTDTKTLLDAMSRQGLSSNSQLGEMIVYGKKMQDTLPDLMAKLAEDVFQGDKGALIDSWFESGGLLADLPEQMKSGLLTEFNKLTQAVRQTTEGAAEELISKGNVKRIIDESLTGYQDLLEFLSSRQEEINRVVQQQVEFANKRLDLEKKAMDAQTQLVNMGRDFADQFVSIFGGERSLGQIMGEREADIRRLSGVAGISTSDVGQFQLGGMPNDRLGDRAFLLMTQRNVLEERLRNRTPRMLPRMPSEQNPFRVFDEGSFSSLRDFRAVEDAIEAEREEVKTDTNDLMNIIGELDKTTEALKRVADTSRELASINREMVNLERKRQTGKSLISDILKANPVERTQMMQDMIALAEIKLGTGGRTRDQLLGAERATGLLGGLADSLSLREQQNVRGLSDITSLAMTQQLGIENVSGKIGELIDAAVGGIEPSINQLKSKFNSLADDAQKAQEVLNQMGLIDAERAINIANTVIPTSLDNVDKAAKKFSDTIDNITLSLQKFALVLPGIQPKNSGGFVGGAFKGDKDSVMAALTPGEFVVRRKVAQKHKDELLALNSGMGFGGGYNDGGFVGYGKNRKYRDELVRLMEQEGEEASSRLTNSLYVTAKDRMVDDISRMGGHRDEVSRQLLQEMFPQGFAPYSITDNESKYVPGTGRVQINRSHRNSIPINVFAHEQTHALQHGPGEISNLDYNRNSYRAGAEIGPTLLGNLADYENRLRGGAKPLNREYELGGGYSPNIDWLRAQAEKHGIFRGESIDRLLSENPQFVRMLARKKPTEGMALPSLNESMAMIDSPNKIFDAPSSLPSSRIDSVEKLHSEALATRRMGEPDPQKIAELHQRAMDIPNRAVYERNRAAGRMPIRTLTPAERIVAGIGRTNRIEPRSQGLPIDLPRISQRPEISSLAPKNVDIARSQLPITPSKPLLPEVYEGPLPSVSSLLKSESQTLPTTAELLKSQQQKLPTTAQLLANAKPLPTVQELLNRPKESVADREIAELKKNMAAVRKIDSPYTPSSDIRDAAIQRIKDGTLTSRIDELAGGANLPSSTINRIRTNAAHAEAQSQFQKFGQPDPEKVSALYERTMNIPNSAVYNRTRGTSQAARRGLTPSERTVAGIGRITPAPLMGPFTSQNATQQERQQPGFLDFTKWDEQRRAKIEAARTHNKETMLNQAFGTEQEPVSRIRQRSMQQYRLQKEREFEEKKKKYLLTPESIRNNGEVRHQAVPSMAQSNRPSTNINKMGTSSTSSNNFGNIEASLGQLNRTNDLLNKSLAEMNKKFDNLNINIPEVVEMRMQGEVAVTFGNSDSLTNAIAGEISKRVNEVIRQQMATIVSPLSGELVG